VLLIRSQQPLEISRAEFAVGIGQRDAVIGLVSLKIGSVRRLDGRIFHVVDHQILKNAHKRSADVVHPNHQCFLLVRQNVFLSGKEIAGEHLKLFQLRFFRAEPLKIL